MKILIVDDTALNCMILEKILSRWGVCSVAANGRLAVDLFREAHDEGKPYDLVCLDIMMPVMDGHRALELIREEEDRRGVVYADRCKVIMTSTLSDPKNVMQAYYEQCDAYITKPYIPSVFHKELKDMGFREPTANGELQDTVAEAQRWSGVNPPPARATSAGGAL